MTADNSDLREQRLAYLDEYRVARDYHQEEQRMWHGAAIDCSRTMFNMLFVINGGGLLSLPAFAALLPKDISASSELAPSATIFATGLMVAFLTGIFTVWNFRTLATQSRMHEIVAIKKAGLSSINNTDEYAAKLKEIQKEGIRVDSYGNYSIPISFFVSWSLGITSAVCFVFAAAMIGGDTNPICRVLDLAGSCSWLLNFFQN